MWIAAGALLLAMAYVLHLGAFTELVRAYHLWGTLLVVLMFIGLCYGIPIPTGLVVLVTVLHIQLLIGIALSLTPKMQQQQKGK